MALSGKVKGINRGLCGALLVIRFQVLFREIGLKHVSSTLEFTGTKKEGISGEMPSFLTYKSKGVSHYSSWRTGHSAWGLSSGLSFCL